MLHPVQAMASKDEALSRAYSQAEELKHTSESLQARIRQLEGKLAAGQQELRKNTEAIAGYRDTAAVSDTVSDSTLCKPGSFLAPASCSQPRDLNLQT